MLSALASKPGGSESSLAEGEGGGGGHKVTLSPLPPGIAGNCLGNLAKCRGFTHFKLSSCTRGVDILCTASCHRNLGKAIAVMNLVTSESWPWYRHELVIPMKSKSSCRYLWVLQDLWDRISLNYLPINVSL